MICSYHEMHGRLAKACCLMIFLSLLLLITASCGMEPRTSSPRASTPPSGVKPAQSRSAGQAPQQFTDIRQVDFRNFTYVVDSSCVDDSEPLRVTNGEYRDESRKTYFSIADVVYGDLTGDGRDEAAVRIYCEASGGRVSEAYIYTLRDEQLKQIATLDPGHGAFGGIISIAISKQLLKVERMSSEKDAATPEHIDTETLRWNGEQWISAGKPKRRKYLRDENSGSKN